MKDFAKAFVVGFGIAFVATVGVTFIAKAIKK